MAGYILDTHVVLWSALEPERLSRRMIKILTSPNSNLFMSAASVWELSIKHAKGALLLDKPCDGFVAECIEALHLSVLPIQWQDCIKAAALPKFHADPFDRMIVQHAKDRNLPIITVDPLFGEYKVKIVK